MQRRSATVVLNERLNDTATRAWKSTLLKLRSARHLRARRKNMRIEHAGLQVSDPAAMGDWYVKHLAFTIKRASDSPVPVRFIADASGKVMLEIYNNPRVSPPDYFKMDPLLLHFAFVCDDIDGNIKRLKEAGATDCGPIEHTPAGDTVVFLRDPWGIVIQLCQRAKPMV